MKILTFGEIMLRLKAPGHERFFQSPMLEATFGGGEANVAVSLANYGMDAAFLTVLPQNTLGDACVGELRRFNVDTGRILRGPGRMGIYYLEAGANQLPSKVIYDRAHSSLSEIKPGMIDWDAVFDGADWFHWTGITPAISQGAADVCLEAIHAASERGIKISCDLNYRKNLWKYGKTASEVMPELVAGCDVIIGNEEDAAKVFGIVAEGFDADSGAIDESKFKSVATSLMLKFPKASKVAITLRGSVNADFNTWSAVLFDGMALYSSRHYDITDIVDRVGGGDSFAGGLIYGLLHYTGNDRKALEFAVAASCLKHTISGDYNRVTVQEVESLMNGNVSGRVSR